MKPQLKTTLVVSIVPTVLVSTLFYVLLGHRRDYLGHYAAGYGGTLSAIAMVATRVPLYALWSCIKVVGEMRMTVGFAVVSARWGGVGKVHVS